MLAMTTGNRRIVRGVGRLATVPQPKKGMKLAAYRLRPEQVDALRKEALRRAAARSSGKPDASELVREAVDMWLAAAKPRHKP